MEDHDIIALYFKRDEQAISQTAQKYGGYCMQISYNILQSRPDAEECVNDTYLKTWQIIPPERPNKFKAFLGCITRNLSLDRYRHLHAAKRNRDLEVAWDELSDCIPMKDEDAEELPRLLNEFLGQLSATDRKIMVKRYWYAMSPSAIAEDENMTTNAVTVRLYKTRQKLRDFLTERGYRL